MRHFRHTILTTLLLCCALFSGAQTRRAVLSGYVLDAASGEPLVQAVVYLEDRKTAAVDRKSVV